MDLLHPVQAGVNFLCNSQALLDSTEQDADGKEKAEPIKRSTTMI
jgi:hypothetical protein